ncbi:unnamed protein product [Xylocopa violacea]|uniref:Uncharacterized protein n=1 Tax=Xylocopa violacea TaxID=135666 RepID=A0ABP1PBA9_XYLVO
MVLGAFVVFFVSSFPSSSSSHFSFLSHSQLALSSRLRSSIPTRASGLPPGLGSPSTRKRSVFFFPFFSFFHHDRTSTRQLEPIRFSRNDTTPRSDPPGSLCRAPSTGPRPCPRPGPSRARDSQDTPSRPPDPLHPLAPRARQPAPALLISSVYHPPGSGPPALYARLVHPTVTCRVCGETARLRPRNDPDRDYTIFWLARYQLERPNRDLSVDRVVYGATSNTLGKLSMGQSGCSDPASVCFVKRV